MLKHTLSLAAACALLLGAANVQAASPGRYDAAAATIYQGVNL